MFGSFLATTDPVPLKVAKFFWPKGAQYSESCEYNFFFKSLHVSWKFHTYQRIPKKMFEEKFEFFFFDLLWNFRSKSKLTICRPLRDVVSNISCGGGRRGGGAASFSIFMWIENPLIFFLHFWCTVILETHFFKNNFNKYILKHEVPISIYKYKYVYKRRDIFN